MKSTTQIEDSSDYKYDAFISYRHSPIDKRWARWLQHTLEAYRPPGRLIRSGKLLPRRLRVFVDTEELTASPNLSLEIEKSLVNSQFLVVVCSPRTPHSLWVNEEVERFVRLGREQSILVLHVEGDLEDSLPNAFSTFGSFAEALAHDTDADSLPLAADVRPVKGESTRMRKSSARLQLLAPILGCDFYDLRNREQERRIRQMIFLGSGSTVLTLFFAILLTALFFRNREAVQQRERAQINLLQAQNQATVALETLESLIYEIQDVLDTLPGGHPAQSRLLNQSIDRLSDVSRTLTLPQEPDVHLVTAHLRLGHIFLWMGRLDEKGSTIDALHHFKAGRNIAEKLVAHDPNDYLARAKLYNSHIKLGDVYTELAPLSEAQKHYNQALEIMQGLVDADPTNELNPRDLMVAHMRVAKTNHLMGNFPAAKNSYRSAHAIADACAKKYPADPSIKRDLAVSFQNLGLVAESPSQAEDFARKSLQLANELVDLDPTDPEFQAVLAESHEDIGQIKLAIWDLDAAYGSFLRSKTIRESLCEVAPKSRPYQIRLSQIYSQLGDIALKRNDPETSVEYLRKCLEIDKKLLVSDPASADRKYWLSVTHAYLGNALRAAGEAVNATNHLETSLTLIHELIATDQDNLEFLKSAWMTCHRYARLKRETNDLKGALDLYLDALRFAKLGADFDAGNVIASGDVAVCYMFLARCQRQMADQNSATSNLNSALEILDLIQQSPNHYADPRLADLRRDLQRDIDLCEHEQRAIADEVFLRKQPTPEIPRLLFLRCVVLGRQGDHDNAMRLAEELSQYKPENAANLYNAGCAFAQCAAGVSRDASLQTAEKDRLVETCTQRTIELLRKAIIAGFFHEPGAAQLLTTDSDFESIRTNESFQSLQSEVSKI